MLLEAVRSVTTSDDFKIKSPEAQKAVDIASKVVARSTHEVGLFSNFSAHLVENLKSCFKSRR